jgi:hypothetical protein
MEFIAKEIELNNSGYNGKRLALCIHSVEQELMASIVAAYPITCHSQKEPMYVKIDGKEYRVVAFLSKDATTFDGEVLKEDDLFWCDPKALHTNSKKEYFPIKKLLFTQRGEWISAYIYVKRVVYRIL